MPGGCSLLLLLLPDSRPKVAFLFVLSTIEKRYSVLSHSVENDGVLEQQNLAFIACTP